MCKEMDKWETECEFGNFPEQESIALLYAQYWTENAGNPDTNARKRMIDFYGERKTEYIEFYMQMVNMGNIISNTVEAYKNNIIPETGKMNFFLYIYCVLPLHFL